MSAQGSRSAKQDGAVPQAGGARDAARANPGRRSLSGELEEGDGLPYRQKSLFEASTGRDLSHVRVHTGEAAGEQAQAVNARAYAEGSDIVFAPGQYKPGTNEGDALLAHEVAHVVQQDGAAPAAGAPKTTEPGDRAEKNADQAAAAMLEGRPAEVTQEPVQIARRRNDEAVDAPAPAAAEAPAAGEAAPKEGEEGKAKEGDEELGELSAERVGQTEESEGEDAGPIGPPQNLEAGKQELAAKGAALPQDGGGDELAGAGAKEAPAGGGGGASGDVELTPELQASIGAAQADAQEAAGQAKSEADAYKAEMKERRDRFDNEQNAMTLEQLKAMSPADKRSTLVEMGYDQKKVKKMKDAELDGVISGKLEQETRKTKILGMDPEELAKLTPAQKAQHLVDLGIDKKDIDKIGPAKASQAFDDVMRVAHVPGNHKVKVKVKGGLMGKSWELNIKVDGEGNPDIEAKKKGGFLSKLWGWVKAALPIILTVLAPLTGGASLIVLAVYQTVTAIATGDWLGAIVGAAGAFVGLGALSAIKNGAGAAASAFRNIANVAGKVKKVADAAKAAMMASKAKSPGSLLAALATGASGFADFAANSAGKFATTMNRWADRLEKWGNVVSGGEKVVAGIKSGDPAGAIAGAFDAAAAVVSKPDKKTGDETSGAAKNLQRYSRIAGYTSAGQRAVKAQPPDYGAVVEAAMGIAGELKTGKRMEDATRITGAASRLSRAIQTNDPSQLAAAAIQLAESIHLAKYAEAEDKDGDGKLDPQEEREKVQKRYATASSVVKFASTAITAASAKPRPNYLGALDAATQLIADLTENKKVDQAALLTQKFDAWTKAVQSKNENAIIEAGKAFGEAINGMKDIIVAERDEAKKAAAAKLGPGEVLEGEDGGVIPSVSFDIGLVELPGTVVPNRPDLSTPSTPTEGAEQPATDDTAPAAPKGPGPQSATPNANYTVVQGDTLSGIAQRFKVPLSQLRNLNPQLVDGRVYLGQRIVVPGAEKQLTASVDVKTDYAIDPTVAAGSEAEAKQIQRRVALAQIKRVHDQTAMWLSAGGNGNDFAQRCRDLAKEADRLDNILDRPTVTAAVIRVGTDTLRTRYESLERLWEQRQGQRNFGLDAALWAATITRDGAGMLLNVLDRTRIISTGYQSVIGAIDAYVKTGSGAMAAWKAATTAFFEVVSPIEANGFISTMYNEAFKTVGKAINDYMIEISKPGITAKEKREIGQRYLVRVGIDMTFMAPTKWGIEANSSTWSNLTKTLVDLKLELMNKAIDKAVLP